MSSIIVTLNRNMRAIYKMDSFTLLVIISLILAAIRGAKPALICKKLNESKYYLLGGHNLFENMIEANNIFADKSLLIKDFIEHPAKVILVTCPRAWGKTTNLQMLENFFQPQIDNTGQRVANQNAFNYKVFVLGQSERGEFTQMNIAKHPDIIGRYLGQYPVIRLNMDAVFDGDDAKIDSFKFEMSRIYDQHWFLANVFQQTLKNTSASEAEKKTAKAHNDLFSKFWLKYQALTENEAVVSLKFLSERLHEYWGKKPFILLESYDKTINRVFHFISDPPTTPECKQSAEDRLSFLCRLFKATFIDNTHFEKAFITGVMHLEVPRLFSNIPGFAHYNAIRNDFYKYYGLNEDEIKEIFKQCGITGQLAKDAKEYYEGYRVTNDLKASIYNIQSIHKFLKEGYIVLQLEPTSNCCNYEKLLSKKGMKSVTVGLINGTSYAVKLNDLSFTVDDYCALNDMLGKQEVTESEISTYLKFLLSEGHLTVDLSGAKSGVEKVKVPNKQVAEALSEEIRCW